MTGTRTPKLELVELVKRYGDLLVLDGIDLRVGAGELVALIGASGCGKSTLLSIAAGLMPPTDGEVLVDGREVVGPGRDRGLVFQSYTLYPWRTVRQNVAFGLELRKLPAAEIRERVDHYLDVMGLHAFAGALPKQLSGGMKQRTAIARAMANEPEVLLLDEPFGALDAQTREAMQEFLLRVWRETAMTILLVTHDVLEAAFLSQRIYVLSSRPGRVEEEVAVPFGPDRDHSLLREARFHALVDDLRELLRRHAAPAGAAAPSSPSGRNRRAVAGGGPVRGPGPDGPTRLRVGRRVGRYRDRRGHGGLTA